MYGFFLVSIVLFVEIARVKCSRGRGVLLQARGRGNDVQLLPIEEDKKENLCGTRFLWV
jgi:hypothetical protein